MSDENHKDIKFWVGFFVGGLLGAIILFFLGTKEGKKTGRQLEEKGRDLFDDLLERLEEFEKKGKELITEGEVVKEQVMDVIEEKKEELTDTATDKIDSALAHIEALQERGRETTAALRRRFKNIPRK